MSRTGGETTSTFAVLVGMFAALAGALVVPTSAMVASGTGVTILAMALAAVLVVAMRVLGLAGPLRHVSVASDNGPPPVLRGRVTDTAHHPLRPRAPGQA